MIVIVIVIAIDENKIEMIFRASIVMVGNTPIRETNEMETIKTLSPAVRGAALKRERKAAAVLARTAGKAVAAQRRADDDAAWLSLVMRGREELEKNIVIARKAMGVHKSEDTPLAILRMIPTWENEMVVHCWRCMEEWRKQMEA